MRASIAEETAVSNTDSGPYEEGKIAASEGRRITANPYEKDTDEFDLWREGFKSDEDEESDDDMSDE
ncbi:hypothetical protein ASG54_10440 [Aureimonas sp. Leaf460]|nr:hypothetical protein ASG62_07845 [Aureimonas sp. Leaf427]KQT79420.1 hypothetical protein ASG54_10440 [Aureimonas sp. Leaf460]